MSFVDFWFSGSSLHMVYYCMPWYRSIREPLPFNSLVWGSLMLTPIISATIEILSKLQIYVQQASLKTRRLNNTKINCFCTIAYFSTLNCSNTVYVQSHWPLHNQETRQYWFLWPNLLSLTHCQILPETVRHSVPLLKWKGHVKRFFKCWCSLIYSTHCKSGFRVSI